MSLEVGMKNPENIDETNEDDLKGSSANLKIRMENDSKVLLQIEEDLSKARAIINSCADALINVLDWRTEDQRRLQKSVMKKLVTIGKHIGLIIQDISTGKAIKSKNKMGSLEINSAEHIELKKTGVIQEGIKEEDEIKIETEDGAEAVDVEDVENLVEAKDKDLVDSLNAASEVIVKCEPELYVSKSKYLDEENGKHFDDIDNCDITNPDGLDHDLDGHGHDNHEDEELNDRLNQDNLLYNSNCDNLEKNNQKPGMRRKVERVAKLLSCEDCGKMISAQNFVRHKKSVHTPIKCDVCDQLFPGTKLLIQHKHGTHDAEKRFIHMCDMCGYRTDVEKHLKRHREAKHETWKYTCEWCSKLFSSSETLKQHIRVHTGERPYVCKICGKAFKQGTQLSRHKITHTDLKPFECNICGRTFNQKGNMKTHMKNHIKSE